MEKQADNGEGARPASVSWLRLELNHETGALDIQGGTRNFTETLGMLENALVLVKHDYAVKLAVRRPPIFLPSLRNPSRL